MKLINNTRNVVLADGVEAATTWPLRLKGLLFRRSLPAGSCMILAPCSSVHTCFMKFDLDLLFVNQQGIVLYIMEQVVPGRFSPVVRKARYVAELPAGTVHASGTRPGDKLNLSFSGILAGNDPLAVE